MPDTRQYVFVGYDVGDYMGSEYDIPAPIRRQVRSDQGLFLGPPTISATTQLRDLRFRVKGNYASSSLNAVQRGKLAALGAVHVADLNKIDMIKLSIGHGFGNSTLRNLRAAASQASVHMTGTGWPHEITFGVQILPEALTVVRLMTNGNDDQAKRITKEAALSRMTGMEPLTVEDIKQGLTLYKQSELSEAQAAVSKIRESLRKLEAPTEKKAKEA